MAKTKIKPCPMCKWVGGHEATCMGAKPVEVLTADERFVWLTAFATTKECCSLAGDRAVRNLREHFSATMEPSLLKNPNLQEPS